MALRPKIIYPGQVDVSDPRFPHGKAQNRTAPGAGNGTPWEQKIVNDLLGWQQALLAAAGITPSDTQEGVGVSDYVTAITSIAVTQILSFLHNNFVWQGLLRARDGLGSNHDVEADEDLVAHRDLLIDRNAEIGGDLTAGHNVTLGSGPGDFIELKSTAQFDSEVVFGPAGFFVFPNFITGPTVGGELSIINSVVYWGFDSHPSTPQNFSLPDPGTVPTGSFLILSNLGSGGSGNVTITGVASTGPIPLNNLAILVVRTAAGLWRWVK